jgi:hypothetical protein
VQLRPKPLTDQIQARCQGFGGCTVGDDHHLRSLRAPFHDHLQVAGKAEMGVVGVARYSNINQGAPHLTRDAVDQGVMHTAVRNVYHAVSFELEQPELGRAQPAADGKPRAEPKPRGLSGKH